MKIAYTGTHGTGKTTSVLKLSYEMKMKHHDKNIEVFMENAKHSPLPINLNSTQESQLWIFTNQIQQEIYLSSKADILILDRTCIDSIAYTRHRGFTNLAKRKLELAKYHIHSYDTIYFKTIKNNDYCFEDKTRIHDNNNFRQTIEDMLLEYYEILNKEIILI